MKYIDKFAKVMTPVFKIAGTLEIIIAILYITDFVKPENYKWDLALHMILVGLIMLCAEYVPKENK